MPETTVPEATVPETTVPETTAPEVTVRAAGGVLWRRGDAGLEVALVHRPKYDDWSLPKGKLEPGELPVAGAVREVAEETGFTAVPGRSLGVSRYRVLHRGRDAPKTVQWWAMRAVEGAFTPNAEVDQLQWVPLPTALRRASSGFDCAPLRAFAEGPADTATVLLVEAADGADPALVDALRAYRPDRLVGGPGAACAGLAAALGTHPATAGGAADPVDLVRQWSALGGCTVVCSDAASLARAVAALTSTPCPPGSSTWALSIDGGRVVDAARPVWLPD